MVQEPRRGGCTMDATGPAGLVCRGGARRRADGAHVPRILVALLLLRPRRALGVLVDAGAAIATAGDHGGEGLGLPHLQRCAAGVGPPGLPALADGLAIKKQPRQMDSVEVADIRWIWNNKHSPHWPSPAGWRWWAWTGGAAQTKRRNGRWMPCLRWGHQWRSHVVIVCESRR